MTGSYNQYKLKDMNKNKKGFWDFACENPDIVWLIAVFGIIGITISICALAGAFN